MIYKIEQYYYIPVEWCEPKLVFCCEAVVAVFRSRGTCRLSRHPDPAENQSLDREVKIDEFQMKNILETKMIPPAQDFSDRVEVHVCTSEFDLVPDLRR